MERMVELNLDPIIKTYLTDAYSLSVVLANPERMDWVLGQYAQLRYIKKERETDTDGFFFDILAPKYWPILTCQLVKLGDLEEAGIDVISFIKKRLEEGYVIEMSVDEHYIEQRFAYQRGHYMHALLICGYDDEKELFHVLGYTDKRRYERTTASMDEVIKGMHASGNGDMWIYKDSGLPYTIRRERLRKVISDYRAAIHEGDTFESAYYGMEACALLEERIRKYVGVYHVDDKAFRLLMEHKLVMYERLKRLAELMEGEQKTVWEEIAEEYRMIAELAVIVRNRLLKYEMGRNESDLHRVHGLLKELNGKERSFFERYSQVICSVKE